MHAIAVCVLGCGCGGDRRGPFRECKYASRARTRGSPPLLNSSWPLPSCGVTSELFTSQALTVYLLSYLRLRLPYHFRCRLALYVYEYLLHVGAQKSAQTFLSEVSEPFHNRINGQCHPRARIRESWHCWRYSLNSTGVEVDRASFCVTWSLASFLHILHTCRIGVLESIALN